MHDGSNSGLRETEINIKLGSERQKGRWNICETEIREWEKTRVSQEDFWKYFVLFDLFSSETKKTAKLKSNNPLVRKQFIIYCYFGKFNFKYPICIVDRRSTRSKIPHIRQYPSRSSFIFSEWRENFNLFHCRIPRHFHTSMTAPAFRTIRLRNTFTPIRRFFLLFSRTHTLFSRETGYMGTL